MELIKGDITAIQQLIKAYRFTDEETLIGIPEIFDKYNYVACPHTAIAYLAAKNYALENPNQQITKVFLSTAHACKFPEVFPKEVLAKLEIPDQVKALKSNAEHYIELGRDFKGFKNYLLNLS